ncbi:Dps family protein [Cesiribacter sp. SM1]|uniref:Dps family protein n=1 Tax=Cesiribacter sp. SM1 TaxID=2861196 RepID=UPI001CD7A963|nr:Dps family protein [Cesiribacter sp. SM1]
MKNNKHTAIGLSTAGSEQLAELLNGLLADFQLYYQNLRGFHWNVRGQHFFELHARFEQLYTEAQENIDSIAERILTLGYTPLHTFEDYRKVSDIPAHRNLTDGKATVKALVEILQSLLIRERKALQLAQEAADEGTVELLTGLISAQEKHVWMQRAWLNE